jgi:hypothetical protein
MARFRVNDALTAAKVFDDEAVVINVVTGRYYDLEGSAALAWSMLSAGGSPDEVVHAFVDHFDVDPGVARPDVDALVDQLLAEELVVAAPDLSPPPPPEPPSERSPYSPPAMTIYSDMEDLLTSDPPLPAA